MRVWLLLFAITSLGVAAEGSAARAAGRPAAPAAAPAILNPAPAAAPAPVIVGPRPQTVDDRYVPTIPGFRVSTWITRLDNPWSIVFLPDGRALVSERAGAIRVIEQGRLKPDPLISRTVVTSGEGGLMGLALHPRFPQQPYLYAMETVGEGNHIENRVVRFWLNRDRGQFDRVILGGIPAGTFHNGGRLAFGPDGRLYITTGDSGRSLLAQNPASLAGKVLRISDDGTIPPENPIPNSPVFTLGNRNSQGLAWDPQTGRLLASEHGPSGEFGLHAFDEINILQANGNYGWPLAVGAPHEKGLIDPIVAWPNDTTPPTGMTFWHGDLFVATLSSQALIRIGFERTKDAMKPVAIERWFARGPAEGRFGRLRDAVVGLDNALYVLTSNKDGRGDAAGDDDKIIRIELIGAPH